MSSSLAQIQQNTKSRFPRLQECAHFHYEVNTIDLPKNFKCALLTQDQESDSSWFQLQVTSNDKKWIIYRSLENFSYLDKHLHDCIFDRKFSLLDELKQLLPSSSESSTLMTSSMHSNVSISSKKSSNKHLIKILTNYLVRFGEIAFINPLNCGPILNWFEIDNKGNRLLACDDSPINIPGVAAAVVRKRYVAQNLDEICLDVGNMISVIDMPPPDESVWWRGKKELEVGFFPADCVELIKCNQSLPTQVADNLSKTNQSVRVKHGKLITLLRSFFNTRPARNQLQQKGILKQRVFACDLGEHLINSQQEIPKILKICTDFIEKHGIVDGIYRHTGLQSNIQKLRYAFDEEKFSEIEQEIYVNDVHSVSSLLKMYFRELPNPLLTYQLYHKFISIAESLMKSAHVEDKIIEIHDVVQQLPPPHYRTLAFLMKHLHKLAEYSPDTNMNTKNLAIVWAPNLLKSKEMDQKDCMQYDMLHSITLQANISEFLIANADTIFNDKFASLIRRSDLNGSIKSNNASKTYRPISVCYNNKLLTLEEAQDKYKQVGPSEMPKYHTVIEIPDLKKKKSKPKENKPNIQSHSIPTNVQIQHQFEQLSSLPSSHSTHSISSPKQIEPPSSPAFKSIFRTLRVGSMKHQPSSPTTQITLQEQADLLSQKPSINTSGIVRTASTSTFKPPSSSVGISETTKIDYTNCINQLQTTAQQAIQSNLSSFTGTISSPQQQIIMRNNRLNQSSTSIQSTIPSLSTFKDCQSDRKSEAQPVPSKRRTIQPTPTYQTESSIPSSSSSSSLHLCTFNRQPSIKMTQSSYDENDYDDIDSNPDTITNENKPEEDEMQQIVKYINEFENSINIPEAKTVDEQNSTLIQSIIDDEEPSKLRLSSSSLSSSADSLIDDQSRIDRRTYIINKIYDNLEEAGNDECFEDDQYEKVVITKESDYDNDLLVNQDDSNVLIVSRSKDSHIYENPVEIRESTGFEIEHKNETVYENVNFDNQLVELNNQIKQLLSETAEREQELSRNQSDRSPRKSRTSMGCQTDPPEDDSSVRSKIKLMEQIVNSNQKSERSSSSSSSSSSSRSPPISPKVKPPPVVAQRNVNTINTQECDVNEERKSVKELLSKFEQK